ncbi:hypothetical protein GIB67_017153 [Kingdonia uniflora]|uniref:CCHC-type domain-containing protein n=1 Tax=Kingdonia uniflora TaxID=39325 RepID=A0A7J7M5W1_9MAGN|nr:hypothetical protein GIB67_017153 [Kingdonia uniflora]
MNHLKLENLDAHNWLLKEPFEHWARSQFDFTAKCEHITNNFSKSFNMWILKIKDRPIHKLLEKLNIMLMKLMYDTRLKAKEWEEAVASYAQTYKNVIYPVVDGSEWEKPTSYFLPPPLVRGVGRPRKQRIPDPDGEKRQKRCGKCGGYGHNKKTCKGITSNTKAKSGKST